MNRVRDWTRAAIVMLAWFSVFMAFYLAMAYVYALSEA